LIIQKLKAKDVGGREKIDNTGVYRALQTMEKKAMVASSWDVEGVGAAKKIYRITPVGQRCLLDWRNTLMEYRNSIGSLITDIEAVIGSEAGRDGF
jgi:DNA-binding PadR family transcriptional regulator